MKNEYIALKAQAEDDFCAEGVVGAFTQQHLDRIYSQKRYGLFWPGATWFVLFAFCLPSVLAWFLLPQLISIIAFICVFAFPFVADMPYMLYMEKRGYLNFSHYPRRRYGMEPWISRELVTTKLDQHHLRRINKNMPALQTNIRKNGEVTTVSLDSNSTGRRLHSQSFSSQDLTQAYELVDVYKQIREEIQSHHKEELQKALEKKMPLSRRQQMRQNKMKRLQEKREDKEYKELLKRAE